MTDDRKDFWWWNNDKKFTKEEIDQLIEKIKVFNAGAIDEYLSKHVDEVYREWLANN